MKKYIRYITALVLTAFGLLTLYLTSSIIFDLFGMREKQGNYVMFVIGANFICAWIYLVAAYALLRKKKWTTKLLATAVLILILTFIAFQIYINNGGIHKADTTSALIFRAAVSVIAMVMAYFTIGKKE